MTERISRHPTPPGEVHELEQKTLLSLAFTTTGE